MVMDSWCRGRMGRRLAAALWTALADGLAPQRCLVCGRFGAALHDACAGTLPAAAGARCARCWAPVAVAGSREAGASGCARCATMSPAFAALRTPYVYAGAACAAVLEAKFAGRSALLGLLGRAAARAVPGSWAVEAVAWVPLHARRRRARGYDQAELLARAVAGELGLPLTGALRRTRGTAARERHGRVRRDAGAGMRAARRRRHDDGRDPRRRGRGAAPGRCSTRVRTGGCPRGLSGVSHSPVVPGRTTRWRSRCVCSTIGWLRFVPRRRA